jgi:hypothetical protein
MSDTEQLFIVAAVWAIAAAFLAYFVRNWGGRIALFAVLVGVPFWELPYGYLNFKRLCDEQGGLRVLEGISPQEKVCVSYPFETSAGRLLAAGFGIVEARDKNGRVTVLRNDQLASEAPKLSSNYCVTQQFVPGLPWGIQRNEYVIIAQANDRVVARHSDFVWFGLWWQQITAPLLGRGGECRHNEPVNSIVNVLLRGQK